MDYDSIYHENENYFGNPFPEVLAWFASREVRGRLLDVGCGQGRNAIPLAEMGYTVHAIDISHEGISQLRIKNEELGIRMEVEERNIWEVTNLSNYNIILLDGFFHFNPHELKSDREILNYLITSAAVNTEFVFCFADHADSIDQFQSLTRGLLTLESESIFYSYKDPISEWVFETAYALFVLKKVK